MTETAVPKRRKTSADPEAPAIAPETAPDKTPHPAPRAKRQSGFLPPTVGSSSTLGPHAQIP